jgi:hypothetical protein
MAAGKWKVYDTAKQYLLNGTHDLDNAADWKVALFLSTSNANTLTLGTPTYGNLTNEHANGNGYTTGGAAVTGHSLTVSGGTTTFDVGDVAWTAASGSIVARFAVLYRDATVNGVVKPLLAVCLLDTAPADVTATDGSTLTVANAGVFTMAGAAVD